MDKLDKTARKFLLRSFSRYLQEVSKLSGQSSEKTLTSTKQEIQTQLLKKTKTAEAEKGRKVMKLFMSYDKTANALANIVNKLREDFEGHAQQGIGPVWNLADHPAQSFYGGGRRKKRRRQKGGAWWIPVLGYCGIGLGLGVRWWAADRQFQSTSHEAVRLIEIIKNYGINLWRIADYQYLHHKNPRVYPPLREVCSPGGAQPSPWHDFDMPFEEEHPRAHERVGKAVDLWPALPAPCERWKCDIP